MKKCVTYLFTILSLLLLYATPSFALALESVYFYHTDPAGSPLVMTDESGAVAWRADYMPFGEEAPGVNANTAGNNKMFVGKELDAETGFYYFGARYMEASVGRFLSPDPVGAVDPWTSTVNDFILLDPQRQNLYAYGLNNPYKYVDPDGNTPWDVLDIAFFSYSFYSFSSNPSFLGAGELALDTIGLCLHSA